MLYVRYPDGTLVTYNDANYLIYGQGFCTLYDREKEPRKWICSIPYESGAIIEAVKACKVESPALSVTPEDYLKYVVKNLRKYDGYWNRQELAKLKKELANFNMQRKAWME